MTFEEWIEQDANGYQEDEHGYLTAKRAWEAGWAEGLTKGYDVGYKDTGICPECLNEVKHKMDCSNGR